jgi:hypothetical protein
MRLNKMSWWSTMLSAISGDGNGDGVEDDKPQSESNPLSPPHPHAHMPTSISSPNEFRPPSPPAGASLPADSSESAAFGGLWGIGALKNSLAATSASLTEVYQVCSMHSHGTNPA